MLKNGEPNPLNVHQLRQVNHLPPHFEQVVVTLPRITIKNISDWLYEHLQGRFYIGNIDLVDEQGKVDRKIVVAFELHREASYFGLALPNLVDDLLI